MGFDEKYLVICCEGKYYNQHLKEFASYITASCLFYTKEKALEASATLDFVHEIRIVECHFYRGMECRLIEGSVIDDFE